jgi:hypothetical protein
MAGLLCNHGSNNRGSFHHSTLAILRTRGRRQLAIGLRTAQPKICNDELALPANRWNVRILLSEMSMSSCDPMQVNSTILKTRN